MSEYICKTGHETNYPHMNTEARENRQTEEQELHLSCKECGAKLELVWGQDA